MYQLITLMIIDKSQVMGYKPLVYNFITLSLQVSIPIITSYISFLLSPSLTKFFDIFKYKAFCTLNLTKI